MWVLLKKKWEKGEQRVRRKWGSNATFFATWKLGIGNHLQGKVQTVNPG